MNFYNINDISWRKDMFDSMFDGFYLLATLEIEGWPHEMQFNMEITMQDECRSATLDVYPSVVDLTYIISTPD